MGTKLNAYKILNGNIKRKSHFEETDVKRSIISALE
jgi:hypothetical protein